MTQSHRNLPRHASNMLNPWPLQKEINTQPATPPFRKKAPRSLQGRISYSVKMLSTPSPGLGARFELKRFGGLEKGLWTRSRMKLLSLTGTCSRSFLRPSHAWVHPGATRTTGPEAGFE